MKNLLLYFFALSLLQLNAQTIPANRIFNWKHSGYNGLFPSTAPIIDVTAFGAIGDSTTDNTTAFWNAMNSISGQKVIYFPAGNYLFATPIQLPDSTTLRGASADSTKLTFDFNGTVGNGINIIGAIGSNFVNVLSGAERYSNSIVVDDVTQFADGDYLELQQTNGSWDTQPISWAQNCIGQILKINLINGDTIFLDSELRIDYDYALNPVVRKIVPRTEISLECFQINRRDSVHVGVCINIYLNYAVNCKIIGIESSKSIGSHIELDACSDCSISNCYIHHNFEYDGTSTHGYGITLFGHTGQCRVENNIMKHLRHSFSFQAGANGNVNAYNYSLDPNRSEFPSDFGADISMHGHFAYSNLFEGNIVQNIQIDQTWGPSGPLNTFFRNRAELYGILMTSGTVQSDSLNFVGNEVTNSGLFMGNYTLAGSGHFEFGNNIKGTITPSGTTPLPDSSYYLDSLPTFWTSSLFPTIGIPNAIGSGTNAAKERYMSGINLATCENTINTNIQDQNEVDGITVYPNPFTNELNIRWTSSNQSTLKFELIDLQGRVIEMKTENSGPGINNFALQSLKLCKGIYFLKITGRTTREIVKVISGN